VVRMILLMCECSDARTFTQTTKLKDIHDSNSGVADWKNNSTCIMATTCLKMGYVNVSDIMMHRVYKELSVVLRDNFQQVNSHRYNKTYL
jgi:hypothetical protein